MRTGRRAFGARPSIRFTRATSGDEVYPGCVGGAQYSTLAVLGLAPLQVRSTLGVYPETTAIGMVGDGPVKVRAVDSRPLQPLQHFWAGMSKWVARADGDRAHGRAKSL